MKINCIAIDDEPLALDIIRDYCNRAHFLNLLQTFDNAVDSIEYIRNNKVDLMFLDIQMEELTGIQLLNALKIRPFVIITTAYDNYAIQGFELDVLDYMLKPISFERFLKGVNRASERILPGYREVEKQESHNEANAEESFFFVKTETRIEKVEASEVLFVEGMGDYWRIVTKNKRIMTLMNARRIEDMLHEPQFCRVHKSFFVALDKIDSIERNRIKIADRLIPVSDTYRNNFFALVEKRKMA
jgi:two-component system, LytTR family, response regulator